MKKGWERSVKFEPFVAQKSQNQESVNPYMHLLFQCANAVER